MYKTEFARIARESIVFSWLWWHPPNHPPTRFSYICIYTTPRVTNQSISRASWRGGGGGSCPFPYTRIDIKRTRSGNAARWPPLLALPLRVRTHKPSSSLTHSPYARARSFGRSSPVRSLWILNTYSNVIRTHVTLYEYTIHCSMHDCTSSCVCERQKKIEIETYSREWCSRGVIIIRCVL